MRDTQSHRLVLRVFGALLVALVAACGPSSSGDGDDDDDDGGDAGSDGGNNQCTPGTNVCIGDDIHSCPDGTVGPTISSCPSGTCLGGTCNDPCAAAAANRSYIGCEYWPVDLDNATEVLGTEIIPGFGCSTFSPSAVLSNQMVCSQGSTVFGECDFGNDCSASPGSTCGMRSVCTLDAQHSPFAVVVSNPQPTAVMVTLSNGTGQMTMDTLQPGQVKALFPQTSGFTDQSLNHSGIESKAYKLVSSAPIVAYQFNPLDNVGVFSNDASLLIPEHAYDIAYTGVTYRSLLRRPGRNDYNGYITVVASGSTPTMVTVSGVTAGVRAGTGVAALSVGGSSTYTLNQFQTLTLEAVANGDLTGTQITCSQPCGVFGGHEATNLSQQNPSPCCADHLEDQIFPNSTWGKVYVVPRSKPRTTAVADMVRVIAQRAGTTVTFNPPQAGCAAALGIGQYCDVFTNADVQITATEPILVGHYLLSNGGTQADAGDPSMSFAVPTEQYRTQYTLLVPSQYNENYFSLVAPAAGSVTLDGTDVTGQLVAFGDGTFKAGRVSVPAGQHNLVCNDGCGVEVYGWSDAVSYLFAGGLDLEQIVIGGPTAP